MFLFICIYLFIYLWLVERVRHVYSAADCWDIELNWAFHFIHSIFFLIQMWRESTRVGHNIYSSTASQAFTYWFPPSFSSASSCSTINKRIFESSILLHSCNINRARYHFRTWTFRGRRRCAALASVKRHIIVSWSYCTTVSRCTSLMGKRKNFIHLLAVCEPNTLESTASFPGTHGHIIHELRSAGMFAFCFFFQLYFLAKGRAQRTNMKSGHINTAHVEVNFIHKINISRSISIQMVDMISIDLRKTFAPIDFYLVWCAEMCGNEDGRH